eukprot:2406876-Pyramimonas_sp.AAC.2
MGVEEITVPARFLTTVAHLIATLTIVYDVVRTEFMEDNIAHDANRHSSLSEYSSEKDTCVPLLTCTVVVIAFKFRCEQNKC